VAASRADDAILAELVERAGSAGRDELLAFRTRVSARQYLPVYDLARAWIPAGSRVLDWGAGSGHFTVFLARAGFRPTAFSFEEPGAAAALAPEAERVRADRSEPAKLPFADRSFDAVCSIGVLEHVRDFGGDEAASLSELTRVLVPGGVLLCAHLPNATSWVEWLARRAPGLRERVHHHRWRYDADSVRALVAGAGLRLLDLRRYGLLPRNELARVPALAGSGLVADVWDRLDALGARAVPWLCTNWLFVARKP
jgi:SAM-dependent methyltransferase